MHSSLLTSGGFFGKNICRASFDAMVHNIQQLQDDGGPSGANDKKAIASLLCCSCLSGSRIFLPIETTAAKPLVHYTSETTAALQFQGIFLFA